MKKITTFLTILGMLTLSIVILSNSKINNKDNSEKFLEIGKTYDYVIINYGDGQFKVLEKTDTDFIKVLISTKKGQKPNETCYLNINHILFLQESK